MAAGRDDLRLAWGWCDHVKTLKLIRLIGFEGPYRLLRLWRYAAENAPSTGRFPSVDDLETAAGWLGAPGAFQQALLACGWLDADGLTLHDWVEEQPYVAKRQERLEKSRISGAEGGRRSVEARRAAQGSASPTLQGSSKGTLEGALREPSRVVEPPLPSLPLPSEEKIQPTSGGPDGGGEIGKKSEPALTLPPLALLWNEKVAGRGLPTVRSWTAARDRTAKTRLREEPDLAVWGRAIDVMLENPWNTGTNPGKWTATFDYLIAPSKAGRLLDAGRAAAEPQAPPVDDYEDPRVRRQRESDAAVLKVLQGELDAGRSLSDRDAERYARLIGTGVAS